MRRDTGEPVIESFRPTSTMRGYRERGGIFDGNKGVTIEKLQGAIEFLQAYERRRA